MNQVDVRMRLRILSMVTLLAATQLAACSHWHPRLEGARATLADPEVRHVRLTRNDGEQVEVRVVEIRGDSIYGTRGNPPYASCEQASEDCTARVPIEDVGFIEVRRFSIARTVAVVAVPVGALALLFVVDEPCSPVDGPC